MKNVYYHSTIKIKLDEICISGKISPNKESPEDPGWQMEWIFLGQYRESSPFHIYLWKTLDKALDCAKFSSSKAKKEYTDEEKASIVIELNIKDIKNISPDPDSKGVRYLGSIPIDKFSKVYRCVKGWWIYF